MNKKGDENVPANTGIATTTTPISLPASSTPVGSVKPVVKPNPTTTPIKIDPKPVIYKKVITTLFWVGEASDEENGYIPNHESFWDSFWMEHYGGIDDPENRCGYNPCKFIPKENPFYFALPYGDRNDDGSTKESIKKIPWYKPVDSETTSLLKNRWIEVKYNNKICYAQWEDVGPFETDDFAYIFGNSEPKNKFGVSAGLDISPATWDCLGMADNTLTEWRFVEEKDVPPGPWKTTVTTRQISF